MCRGARRACITVGYRSRSNNPTFATQLQYRETVAAGVRLSAPRRVSPGRTFAFRGGLAGGYIPRGGTLVSLEILFGGEWREIALLRTNRRGAFAYRYTFAAIGPATYRFRAQLPAHDRLPLRIGREQVQLHPPDRMRSRWARPSTETGAPRTSGTKHRSIPVVAS